jgi:hypothetical protein
VIVKDLRPSHADAVAGPIRIVGTERNAFVLSRAGANRSQSNGNNHGRKKREIPFRHWILRGKSSHIKAAEYLAFLPAERPICNSGLESDSAETGASAGRFDRKLITIAETRF